MRPSPSAFRQSNHGAAQYQGIQFMPDKENGAGILGKKQGSSCTRGLFSQVVQPEISNVRDVSVTSSRMKLYVSKGGSLRRLLSRRHISGKDLRPRGLPSLPLLYLLRVVGKPRYLHFLFAIMASNCGACFHFRLYVIESITQRAGSPCAGLPGFRQNPTGTPRCHSHLWRSLVPSYNACTCPIHCLQ